jgi:hypothetical protein
METGQLEGVLAHLQQRMEEAKKDLIKADTSKKIYH